MGAAVTPSSEACVWDGILGQGRVTSFLRKAVESDKVSHAYLFTGSPGVGKKSAAKAMACALVCDDDGCGTCVSCARVMRGTYPDVHLIEPEGASTYVVGQVRALIGEIALAPVEADWKIYILDRAETLNAESANALLKSLEEPPEDVVFVLLTTAVDSVLPTISSRCQIVRFEQIPEGHAVGLLMEKTGVDQGRALAALAAAGGVLGRGIDILNSRERLEARSEILATVKDLAAMDGQDVLEATRNLLKVVRAPLDGLKKVHADELQERRELLGSSSGSTKPIEERQKRELTAREREGLLEILNVTESWVHDCLAMSRGVREVVRNADQSDAMEEVAVVFSPEAAVRASSAVGRTRRRISYNVSPQLALEAMLFDIREVLRCPR